MKYGFHPAGATIDFKKQESVENVDVKNENVSDSKENNGFLFSEILKRLAVAIFKMPTVSMTTPKIWQKIFQIKGNLL